MKKFYFWIVLLNIIFVSSFSAESSAQTLENKTEKRFEIGLIACGNNGTVQFYKSSDGKYVDLASFKEKTTPEAKNKIEKLVSESNEILQAQTFFNKVENQTGAYYVLRFENSKDKTNSYKIAKFINEHTQIISSSTLELALEFEKWQTTQK